MSFEHTESEWLDLVTLVDFPLLESLPTSIGCPDCADQGALFVEVDFEESSRRVTIDPDAAATGLDELIEALDQALDDSLSRFLALCDE